MSAELNAKYWDERYRENRMGWDIGYPSTPLKSYIDQLNDKSIHLLLPGAGNAYEAEYLWHQGFRNIKVLDWSRWALDNLKKRVPDFPEDHLIEHDFFEHSGKYELILEQTFFCALPKNKREDYVKHMAKILKIKGKLAGVLFNDPLNDDHPPFGGDKNEYLPLFEKYLKVEKMEECYNSIPERQGSELFFIVQKN